LKISENEALEILKVASRRIGLDRIGDGDYAIDNGTHTFPLYVPLASINMLHEEESAVHITTSCSYLDDILGGGINCKEVTEVEPGIGKTQLRIQLAINVQIPADYGGLERKSVYIGNSIESSNHQVFKVHFS
ncbi:DNA repair RAD51 homolog 3 isoform X1, partial [Olea europaea subsp. europaea]